uniref:FLYWCH-type domain-containing protein n=1 Tax=Panagrellus redivivus TaxID=6233 RepID=A0A7E4ZVQ8_PANRE
MMASKNTDPAVNEGASSSTTSSQPTVSSLINSLYDGGNTTLLDELKKQVNAQGGRVEMTGDEIAKMLQDYMRKTGAKDIDSASPLVNALGLNPEDDFDEVDLSSSSFDNDNGVLDGWIHIGRFDSIEAVDAARKQHGVSRHQTGTIRGVTKMKYRCNQWKRNQCLYKMCCFNSNGIYELYASGEHEHTVSEPRITRDRRPNGSLNPGPCDASMAQPDLNGMLLQNALMQAYQNWAANGVLPGSSDSASVMAVPYPFGGFMPPGPSASVPPAPTSVPLGSIQPPTPSSAPIEPLQQLAPKKETLETSEFSDIEIKIEPMDPAEAQPPPPSNEAPDHSPSKRPRSEVPSPPTESAMPNAMLSGMPLQLPESLLNVFQEVTRNDENGTDSRTFSLSSGTTMSSLLKVATDMQLVFVFDARNAAEFCLTKAGFNVAVVFHDRRKHIDVKIRRNDFTVIEEEVWKKGDFQQFIWAVRGKCAFVFNVTNLDM